MTAAIRRARSPSAEYPLNDFHYMVRDAIMAIDRQLAKVSDMYFREQLVRTINSLRCLEEQIVRRHQADGASP